MKQKVLVTGATGQTASYLCELLFEKEYEVYATVRRTSNRQLYNICHLQDLNLVDADLTDTESITSIIKKINPSMIFNFGADSFVGTSFQTPEHAIDTNTLGVVRILNAIKNTDTKFFQASTSEMIGLAGLGTVIDENTVFDPQSPYAISKCAAHMFSKLHRRAYKTFTCNGIMLNTESPRRGMEFVTRKITNGVAQIKLGLNNEIWLGNLDARRDWSYAKDSARASLLMMERSVPDDYVICTGHSHSIKDLLKIAFESVDMHNWDSYVKQDSRFMRPAEVPELKGNYFKAKSELGWEPTMKFQDLVKDMVMHDMLLLLDKTSIKTLHDIMLKYESEILDIAKRERYIVKYKGHVEEINPNAKDVIVTENIIDYAHPNNFYSCVINKDNREIIFHIL